jgi:hypothetical protein
MVQRDGACTYLATLTLNLKPCNGACTYLEHGAVHDFAPRIAGRDAEEHHERYAEALPRQVRKTHVSVPGSARGGRLMYKD